MSTIVLRNVKGSPLTYVEMDANFNNLNTDKLEAGFPATSVANTPAGTISAVTIQAAINELDGDVQLKAPLASPTFTGTPAAPTPTVGDNDTSIATTAFVTTAVAALSFGQCRLAKSGANLLLSPYNGNKLMINGVIYPIPSAGVSLAPTSLAASTVYYIYAYMNTGTMTLEASATAHSTDTTTGVEIKTADASRTLVGMAVTTAGVAWVDDATNIGVISYFNRKPKTGRSAFTANRSTASVGTGVEINSEIRVNFLNWADTGVSIRLNGSVYNSTTAQGITYIGIDGVSATDNGGSNYNSNTSMVSVEYSTQPSEGVNHYSTLCGYVVGASTNTWEGTGSATRRTTNQTTVWG